jgi:hypothetical protein
MRLMAVNMDVSSEFQTKTRTGVDKNRQRNQNPFFQNCRLTLCELFATKLLNLLSDFLGEDH